MPRFNGLTALGRPIDVIVAASDSINKDSADFVCDGTADQTEINSALLTGLTVLLLPGTYSTTARIRTQQSRNILIGYGAIIAPVTDNTVFVSADNAAGSIVSIEHSRCRVIGIGVSDTRSANSLNGVWVLAADFEMTNCEMISNATAGGLGFVLSTGADRARVHDNYFNAWGWCSVGRPEIGNPIPTITDWSITNNVFRQSGFWHILVHGDASATGPRRGLIANNIMQFVEIQHAIYCQGGEIAIVGNVIDNCAQQGIRLGTGMTGIGRHNYVVVGNFVRNCQDGIAFYGNFDGAIIVGNTVKACTTRGLSSSVTAGQPSNIIIANNIIADSVTGMDIETMADAVIEGNMILGNASGIHLGFSGADGDDVVRILIKGNRFNGETPGAFAGQITVNSASNIDIVDNQFLNGGRCVNLWGAIGNRADINIIGNKFVSPSVSAIAGTIEADSLIRDNIGFVTENRGTATILNGATVVTVTHGLARTPTVDDISIILAENPTNDPGIIWVDNITATQFNVNCRNDPGASNLDLAWKAEVR